MATQPLSLEQFGATIKAKHPEYADIQNADLAQKVLDKYPQYKDMVQTAPSVDLSNKQGQGTYAMWDTAGHKLDVPYGQVQTAAQQGYKFDTNPDQSGLHPEERFTRDSAADSQSPAYRNPLVRGVQTAQRAFDAAAQTEPINTSNAGAFAGSVANNLGAGATRVFSPIAHPVDTVVGLAKTAGGLAAASQGNPYPLAETLTPVAQQIAKNPGGEAIAAIPQVAMALVGGAKAPAMAEDAAQAIAPKLGEVGNPVTGLKNMMAGPPEAQMTKALQPAKNNISFGADLKTALPQMKAAEQQLGKPIEGFDDAAQAAILAKKNVWQHVQARLQGAGQQGATIDGNPIADAMMSSIDKRMGIQNPGLTAKIQSIADTYRRPLDVNEAEDFIQSNNKELTGYYAKNKVSQQAAEADPEIAAKVAEGNALRSALYDKLDSLSGPGVAQLKKTYGALSNVQKELTAQQIVYARKAPANLGEQMGYLQAGAKALTGDVVGAAKDIAVRRFLSDLNDKNSMITRSFANVKPAGPFPAPSNPRFAGLLPRGAIQTPQADASGAVSGAIPPTFNATTRAQRLGLLLPEKAGGNVLPYYPQMTADEQAVSRLHYLRNSK